MNLTADIYTLQYTLNALAFIACFFLSAEYIFIVAIRKPPFPWSAYSVSFVLFSLACDRLLKISQPQLAASTWQLISQLLLDSALLLAASMIPLVRKGTYKRPRFNQLKEINQNLVYSQSLLRSYLDEAPIVAYIKDKDRQVTHANAGYARLFGGSIDSVIGKTDLWGDTETSSQRDLQILAGKGEKEVTQTLALKDRACTILDIRFPLSGPNSEAMLGGIAVDITNQLRRKNRIEVLASIVELSPEAIYSLDQSGLVLTWNPAAQGMFGYTAEEMIGQSIIKITPEDKRVELLNMIDSLCNNQVNVRHFESVRVGKDGNYKAVLVAAACVHSGEPAGNTVAVISRDITQRKLIEEQKRALHDELERKVQELSCTNASLQKARDEALESASMKSAFVANISHELRTPLSGILGMSELLARQRLDQDTQILVSMLHESAQALLRVVEDVLDLAKLEAGKTSVDEEIFSVRDLIEDLARLFSAALSAKRLSWQSCIDKEVPDLIRSDPSIIRQIVSNLIANAVQFTQSGGITLSLSVDRTTEARLVLKFSVSDTGVGIDDGRLHQLFTPFARVSQSTEGAVGTGLGLILCKQLVGLLDGELGCISEKEKGSTFWFTVPVRKTEESFSRIEEQRAVPSIRPSELAKYRVLSVDDSPVVSRLTVRQLGIIGVQCEAAVSGKEAIEKIKGGSFDAILLDVHLPDMTGYEVAREIRKLEEGEGRSKAAIIALTGCAAEAVQEQCDAFAMDDFLEKPVTIDMLRTHLLQALSHIHEYRVPPKNEDP